MIDPTAIIHQNSEIGEEVSIGPFSIIGEGVRIGKGSVIGSHVVIEGNTNIGEKCQFFHFSSIGTIPQDLKFKGENSGLIIGSNNVFREFATVNRGTSHGSGNTIIGDNNFFMAYVHIAHDCLIGNNVIMANAATLAGHISIGDFAIIGGLVGIHQFTKIGKYSIIGGCSAVAQDVPPFMSAAGNRAKLYGLNNTGLTRHGFSSERINNLKKGYKLLFRSNLTMQEAIKKMRTEIPQSDDIESLIKFIEESERGICR